ncbi:MAG: hypothetical protein EU550_00595 [Promethearchaeota archaeon]|nr:MAG: hypothetical protein EU550_00595 [Candidatus Lokiarchaeota archaeon]
MEFFMKKFAYCPTCERTVQLHRKNIQHKYHEILFFMIVLTCGLGFFLYLALRFRMPKKFCPHCERDLSDLAQSEKKENVINKKAPRLP